MLAWSFLCVFVGGSFKITSATSCYRSTQIFLYYYFFEGVSFSVFLGIYPCYLSYLICWQIVFL